jgi:hypothetical protein
MKKIENRQIGLGHAVPINARNRSVIIGNVYLDSEMLQFLVALSLLSLLNQLESGEKIMAMLQAIPSGFGDV